jgi:hypothetical protein
LQRFLDLLEKYDGTKHAFSEIFSAALDYLRLSPNVLAVDCETAPITVVRWARGAAPSALARNGAIACLRKVVQQQLEIEQARLEAPRAMPAHQREATD